MGGGRDYLQMCHLVGATIAYCVLMAAVITVSVAVEGMSWGDALTQFILVPALVACLIGSILYLVLRGSARRGSREEDSDE